MAVLVTGDLLAVTTREFRNADGGADISKGIRVLDSLAGEVHVVYVGRDFPQTLLAEIERMVPGPGDERPALVLDVFVSKKGGLYANSARIGSLV